MASSNIPSHVYHDSNAISHFGSSTPNPYGISTEMSPGGHQGKLGTRTQTGLISTPPDPTSRTVTTEGMPPEKKRKHRYFAVVFRILITLGIIAGVVVLLKSFEKKGSLTKSQKYVFNTIMILLTLILALNVTVAHSQIVLLIREGIVNKQPHDKWTFRQERRFNKITGLRTSLSFILEELRPPPGRTSHKGSISVASIFIAVWVFFNLAVAIAIALLGLTYSLEEGGIGTKAGSVSIVNTEHFFYDTHNLETPELIPERFISKLYADISISYLNTTPTTPGPDDQYDLEELEDGWRYNFRESNPARTATVRSDRYIKTSAVCQALKIISFDPLLYNLTWIEANGQRAWVSGIAMGQLSTTYMTRITNDDTGEIYSECGPRCGWVAVAQLVSLTDFSDAWLYDCHSTVHEVTGGTLPEHEIQDRQAKIAATSLSQSGVFDNNGRSFAYYANKVRWGEPANGNHRTIERILSRASAGCIAAMDAINPRFTVPGQEPWSGVEVKVRWPRVLGVLIVVGCLQMIASFSSIWWHVKNWTNPAQYVGGGTGTAIVPTAITPTGTQNFNFPTPLNSPGPGHQPSYPHSPIHSPQSGWGPSPVPSGATFQPAPAINPYPANTPNTGYFNP